RRSLEKGTRRDFTDGSRKCDLVSRRRTDANPAADARRISSRTGRPLRANVQGRTLQTVRKRFRNRESLSRYRAIRRIAGNACRIVFGFEDKRPQSHRRHPQSFQKPVQAKSTSRHPAHSTRGSVSYRTDLPTLLYIAQS